MKIKTTIFAQWCGIKQTIDGYVEGVCIDSRTVTSGDAFFAFKGERVNGEDFALDALDKGASIVIASNTLAVEHPRIIKVMNVERALQKTAKMYRKTLPTKIIGITGSVGKTTTKEMIKAILATEHRLIATRGNFNNEIGLPLMIFDIEPHHEWAVLEMGMNHFKEIHRLADIAKPTIAVITNIGTAHIEFFGTRHKIAEAKFEITDFLTEEDNLVLNGNDIMLRHYREYTFKTHIVGATFDELSYQNVKITENATTFDVKYGNQTIPAQLPVIGEHHVHNAMLAIKVAQLAGLDITAAVNALVKTQSLAMRFNIETIDKFKIINDAYNASQASILASVKTFMMMPYKKHIVVLGDILETGQYAKDLHASIGRALSSHSSIDEILFVGEAMKYAHDAYSGKKQYFTSIKNVADTLQCILKKQDDAVLFKASRGMKLEEIIKEFRGLLNA